MYDLPFQLRLLPFPGINFEAADDKGGGKVELPDDVLKGLRSLIKREGSEEDAARKLYEENYEHRKEIRELKEKAEKAKTLSDEEYAEYESLKAILTENKYEKPEDLKEALKTSTEAKEKLAKLEKEQGNAKVAEIMNWNPKVLNRIGGDKEYEVRTRKNDKGEDEQYVVVKEDNKETELSEYAKAEWVDLLPALEVKEKESAEDAGGKRFVQQKQTNDKSSAGEVDAVAARIARNKKARGIEEES